MADFSRAWYFSPGIPSRSAGGGAGRPGQRGDRGCGHGVADRPAPVDRPGPVGRTGRARRASVPARRRGLWADRVANGVWKQLFAANPLRSDLHEIRERQSGQ